MKTSLSRKMQFMQTSWIQSQTKNLISKVTTIIHLHILTYTNSSFNLSSMKVLIIVRVGFLSTLLHLHKIKDAHFSVIVFLPNRDSLQSTTTLAHRGPAEVRLSTQTGQISQSQITSFLLELLCPAFFCERLNNVEKYEKTRNKQHFFLPTCTWLKFNQ